MPKGLIKVKDVKAEILFNEEIASGYFKMGLDAPGIAGGAEPGQFVQIRCSDTPDPLLRRPFSIHRLRDNSGIEILYEVVGRGTRVLSSRKKGEVISVLGPLGSGFTLPRTTNDPRLRREASERRTTILVAGGIGVAPLVFLAEKLTKLKIKGIVLIGVKTKKLILCEKDFTKLGVEVRISTDDGSRGSKGFVSNLFEKILRTTNHERRTTIYACGPEPMLECIATISNKRKLNCEVSLEERMACGIGACLGCVVKVKDKPDGKLACKDGPVFNASEIIW